MVIEQQRRRELPADEQHHRGGGTGQVAWPSGPSSTTPAPMTPPVQVQGDSPADPAKSGSGGPQQGGEQAS